MDIAVRHNPGFAVARCMLSSGETVRAESGAMMATSAGVLIEAKATGGLMKSIRRSVLGGESFFITSYTAPAGGGWVDCAARLPGDIVGFPVTDGLNITRGSYLCSDGDVQIDTSWGGFKNPPVVRADSSSARPVRARWCSGRTARSMPRISDRTIRLSWTRPHGRWDNSVKTQLRRAAAGGLMQSAKSGEGFVFDIQGPGRIWTQWRNPAEFIGWLTNVLPFTRS